MLSHKRTHTWMELGQSWQPMVTNMRFNFYLDDNNGLDGEAGAHLRDLHVILPLPILTSVRSKRPSANELQMNDPEVSRRPRFSPRGSRRHATKSCVAIKIWIGTAPTAIMVFAGDNAIFMKSAPTRSRGGNGNPYISGQKATTTASEPFGLK